LSNIVSFDFSYSFDSRDLLIVMYIAIAIAAILLLVAFIWFICKADSLNPNEDDGDEAQTWEDLAEENRKTVKALKLIMTGIMSLYLPVSRTVFQILACSDNIVSVAQVPCRAVWSPVNAGYPKLILHAGVVATATGSGSEQDRIRRLLGLGQVRHWRWAFGLPRVSHAPCCSLRRRYTLLFIGALVMLAGFVVFVPVFTYRKIKQNIPVGSTLDPNTFYDEDGRPQPYTDAMFNEDVMKDPRQVKCPYRFLYKGYERKWCWYKVIVMVIKLALCLPIIFLFKYPVAQSLVTLAILLLYSVLSFLASPFISRTSDIMDTSGRITTFLTVSFGLLATGAYPVCDAPVCDVCDVRWWW